MKHPKIGDHVHDIRCKGSWTVVGLSDDRVHLSGPHPCRGIKQIPLDEFQAFYRLKV